MLVLFSIKAELPSEKKVISSRRIHNGVEDNLNLHYNYHVSMIFIKIYTTTVTYEDMTEMRTGPRHILAY